MSQPPASFAPPAHPKPLPRAAIAGLVVALFLVLTASVVMVVRRSSAASGAIAQGVVKVVIPNRGWGTGFFVAGPDSSAYVVTANHVVSSGQPVSIEHTVERSGGHRWIEAYPDTEVVAFDADADVAVLRLNGVSADHVHALKLAAEPVTDEPIVSYGFPASSLTQRFGMVSKPGKILSLVKFPVLDHPSGEILRNDAVDGLLVSSDTEPGFSGGPTCNEQGEVVGVNVTKDTAHRGQNGAVDVSVLRHLLGQVVPKGHEKDPTADDVRTLLGRIQSEYLSLPVERRWMAREQEFISTSDLPRLDEMATAIRRMEDDTRRDPETKLSGQAMLGLVLARLPGRPLETYMDPSTRKELSACQLRERKLQEFFGELDRPDGEGDAVRSVAHSRCEALAFRPLVWDMAALALRWEGRERGITVNKVDTVDAERHVYRASTRFEGVDYVVDVFLKLDGGRLRLNLFDNEGRPVGLSVAQAAPASALSGTWHRSEPRAVHDFGHDVDADAETEETLSVSIGTDGKASVSHDVRRHVFFTGARHAACGGARLDLGLEQSFTGQLREGSIVGWRQKDARPIGVDMARCWRLFTYEADQLAVFKRVGDKLMMYRTNGSSFPESAEFEKVKP